MKKLLFIAAVLGIFAVTSCNKEYTCKCTSVYTGANSEHLNEEVETTISDVKCENMTTSHITSDSTVMTTTCVEL